MGLSKVRAEGALRSSVAGKITHSRDALSCHPYDTGLVVHVSTAVDRDGRARCRRGTEATRRPAFGLTGRGHTLPFADGPVAPRVPVRLRERGARIPPFLRR